ncbi:NifB/NifX family molybdenum-iron cluster-binding protein [Geoalkalibacter halelectricus]|uniref:NifB/NifX family molybdenum-iron cluster-binding protein n=1 Tax=Geoalkalibacter halelectricus TaxID=2847045 RepID=UPI003D1ABC91
MKVCFPVEHNVGLESPVYGHFGSAPLFVLVDSETQEVRQLANRDLHHRHGACSPLKALGGEQVQAIVVGGIGAGALSGLLQAGLKVFQAQGVTVADNLALIKQSGLSELTPGQVCGGHGHGHGCNH